jgi:lipopolysaccharide export LptBFGC system permease protein LptF
MNWARIYRLALNVLPARLRRKHGVAMETLFARELELARTRGWLQGALAGVAGVWDVVRRGVYEAARGNHDVVDEHRDCPLMQQPTARQLLRRHAASLALAFVVLTALLLGSFAFRQLPALTAPDAPAGTFAKALWLAVPFTAAMTIPMAVLVAVLWEFTRLGADGTLTAARREVSGVRRLILPVLGAAIGVAAFAFVVTAEIVPRANARLMTVLTHSQPTPSDRMMTIAELRTAARSVRPDADRVALARAARYQIEIQKKFALPAACVVLALVAIAIGFRVPQGGAGLVIGASLAVFGAYYVMLVAGETLANRLVVSPFIGMWTANVLLLTTVLLAGSKRRAYLGKSSRMRPG